MANPKIIMFELNEVPFFIFDYYREMRPNSAISKILGNSAQYITRDEESNGNLLSPWITWPTLHRGVGKEKHKIRDFGENLDEVDKVYPPVWEITANNSIKTGVFSSLHTNKIPADKNNFCFYVPDPFSKHTECHPKKLNSFQSLNLAMARKSERNVSRKIPIKESIAFSTNIFSSGLKFSTIVKTGKQIAHEFVKPHVKVRRRSFQTVLAFDLFLKQLQTSKPQFTTFFSNNVASAMHRFWRASFPEHYSKEATADDNWVQMYKEEILYAMDVANDCLGTLLEFMELNPEYKLVICTSMGQQAREYENAENILYLADSSIFLKKLGLDVGSIKELPSMKPQFNFEADSATNLEKLKMAFSRLKIRNKDINYREKQNFISIDLGHRNISASDVTIDGKSVENLESIGFYNFKNEEKLSSTAYHIPDGSLIIYPSTQKESRPTIDTLEIAPSILRYFGITPPTYMKDGNIPL